MAGFRIFGTSKATGAESDVLGLTSDRVNSNEEALALALASHSYLAERYTNLYAVDEKTVLHAEWWQAFNALKPLEQELVRICFPRVDEPNRDMSTVKAPTRLLATATQKMIKLGFAETCSRCSGSGQHSKHLEFGTTCFKCGSGPHLPGHGKQAPRLTKSLLHAVREKIAASTYPQVEGAG